MRVKGYARYIAVRKAWNRRLQTLHTAAREERCTCQALDSSKPESVPQYAVDFAPRRHNATPGSNLHGPSPRLLWPRSVAWHVLVHAAGLQNIEPCLDGQLEADLHMRTMQLGRTICSNVHESPFRGPEMMYMQERYSCSRLSAHAGLLMMADGNQKGRDARACSEPCPKNKSQIAQPATTQSWFPARPQAFRSGGKTLDSVPG